MSVLILFEFGLLLDDTVSRTTCSVVEPSFITLRVVVTFWPLTILFQKKKGNIKIYEPNYLNKFISNWTT